MNDNLSFLHDKIREFVKKYYLNRLFKSSLFFVFIVFLAFITMAVLEYYAFFNTTVRTVLFYAFLILLVSTFIFFIIRPIIKILGLGKQISKEEVAKIVGKHFSDIDDKLLNIIQLEKQLDAGYYKSYQLLMTAIDTKITEIKPFPFVKAINFRKTIKFTKWALIPFLLFCLIFSIKSEVFTDSTQRIVHHQQYFEKPAPYHFSIENSSLQVFQNDDCELKIKVEGEELPQEIYVSYHNRSYKAVKISNSEFRFTFTKLQKTLDFQIITDEVSSKIFTLEVLPKPTTISFTMQLNYPAYLNKPNETLSNNGDAAVPEGTIIIWKYYTRNTDSLIWMKEERRTLLSVTDNLATISLLAKQSFDYEIVNKNKFFQGTDTMKNSITVIPDQYPEITVENQRDSFYVDRIYFKGYLKDDYGFHNLRFIYSKYNDKNELLEENKYIDIQINTQTNIQDFYYTFDAGALDLPAGYKIDYFFEVKDNDAPNGFKVSHSTTMTYKAKTMEEIEKELQTSANQSQKDMGQMMDKSAQLLKEIEKFNKDLLQQQNTNWSDNKKMEAMLEKFNELQQQLDELKKQQQQQMNLENQYKNIPQDLLERQKELQKRLDALLTDEMRETIKKMQEMVQKMDKNQMQEAMQKIKLKTEDLKESLDAQLQLTKQLEFEKRVNEAVQKAMNLSEQQKILSKQSEQKAINKEDLLKKQNELQQQFNELKQDIRDIETANKQLEEPAKMRSTQELEKKISEAMNESKSSLEKNNRKNASQKQQESSDNLNQLANQMNDDMLQDEEERLGADMETVRQILDNLLKTSFRQEDNLLQTKKINPRSSAFNEMLRSQFNVWENMQMISDSLRALAKHQPEVKAFVITEVDKIRDYLSMTKTNLNDRNMLLSASNEQFALTSMNNLALMLAESLKNMQKKQSECKNCKSPKNGNGSCSRPGGSGKKKSAAQSARELQQQLNRQMEAMKRSMEQGQKQGQSEQSDGNNASEQFAKMAAQQEALRKMMQDLQGELKSQNGIGDKSLDQIIKDMEQTERELVNKIISQQTLMRQKQIETRLLESERADMQREKEEKRESIEGKEVRNPQPPKDWDMDKLSKQQNEFLKTVPAQLNYYYKEKVNHYFFNIE
jgi:hypothetical protein